MRVAILTTGRHDWSILDPVVRALSAGPARPPVPLVIATGQHAMARRFPSELGGIPVASVVPAFPDRDDGLGAAHAAGATAAGVADALARLRAEALLVVGDRSETLAAGFAATCLRLPLIHLHGGETTLGAIDDACRDALSRLASVHAVAHAPARDRLVAMGIPSERIRVTGAPGLDRFFARPPAGREAVEAAAGRQLGSPFVLLTHHPTTLGGLDPAEEADRVVLGLLDAVERLPGASVVATAPNQDAGGVAIRARLERAAAADPRFVLIDGFGPAYGDALAWADAVVGNSSSGIIEAPTFAAPVVNIGGRQGGRLRAGAVIEAACERAAIAGAVAAVLDHPPTTGARQARPTAYGDGRAAERVRHAVCELLLP